MSRATSAPAGGFFTNWRQNIIYIGFVVIFLVFALTLNDKGLLNPNNLLNIIRQTAMIAAMAVAMTFVLSAGEIDLSVGAVALAGMLYAGRLQSGRFQLGEGDELSVIAAAVLGGTSPFGGKGTVIGTVTARSETREELAALLAAQVAPTRAEEGCINGDLHVDAAAPCVFVLYGNWTSRLALDTHLAMPHLQPLFSQRARMLACPVDIRPLTMRSNWAGWRLVPCLSAQPDRPATQCTD